MRIAAHITSTVTLISLGVILCPMAAAQKGQGVDWEAKQLAIELGQLGGPEIRPYLADLYNAVRASRSEEERASGKYGEREKFFRRSAQTNWLTLLRHASVRREIEMLDDQYEDFRAKSRAIHQKLLDQLRSLLANRPDGISAEEVRQQIADVRAAAEREIERAILPFQLKRLKQLTYHVRMRREGAFAVISSEPLVTELNLSEDQQESLREQAAAIDRQLARDIDKLRAKARERLFAKMRSDQRAKLRRVIGDDFEYDESAEDTATADKGPAKD